MTTKQELEQLKKQFAELEAKIAKEEKQEIKTCEDAFNKLKPEWFINEYGRISQKIGVVEDYDYQHCNITSEKEAKRMKALIQLRLIAEAMNQGVKMDEYWYIGFDLKPNYSPFQTTISTIAPIFHTKELAEQALTNFKPLFEDLYAE
jgi:hypothetical protein